MILGRGAPILRRASRISQSQAHLVYFARTLRTRPLDRRHDTNQNAANQATGGIPSASSALPPPPPPSNKSQSQRPDVSSLLSNIDPASNSLLAPVHIPEDANAVLRSDHPATSILAQSGLVVTRQIEMMNVFLGFEQANRYTIMDAEGNHVGYLAEHDGGFAKTMGRQWFRTHRAFTTHVFDKRGQEVLRFHRPFSWINSRIRVYDALSIGRHAPESAGIDVSTSVKDPATIDGFHHISNLPLESMRVIGEAHSEWAPLRRKYHLFLAHEIEAQDPTLRAVDNKSIPAGLSSEPTKALVQGHSDNFAQFAYINEPFLSWDFSLKGADEKLIGSVNRNFRGFGREIFTDTGMYILRMDSAGLEEEAAKTHAISQSNQGERAYAEAVGGTSDSTGMTLDQRAVMLATAVTVDFDYFSRHSRGGGLFMPMWFGGGEAGGAAGAGAAGAEAGGAAASVGAAEGAGAVVGTAGRSIGGVAGGVGTGVAEGGIAGAGTIAGYEAMQRGIGRGDSTESAPPATGQPAEMDPNSPQYGSGYESQSPESGFSEGADSNEVWGSGQDPWSESSGGGGDGDGGGLLSKLWDAFFGD